MAATYLSPGKSPQSPKEGSFLPSSPCLIRLVRVRSSSTLQAWIRQEPVVRVSTSQPSHFPHFTQQPQTIMLYTFSSRACKAVAMPPS